MKRITILLFLFLNTLIINSQSSVSSGHYQDFGVWSYSIDNNNMISVNGYVKREKIFEYSNRNVKKETISDLPLYKYELILVSNSIHNGEKTSTWLYNARIYINGSEITKEQFPNGFLISVDTKPTIIYWYESSRSDINFKISWDSSVHEPRNLE